MKIGGQIPWNATPICETFKISYLRGFLYTCSSVVSASRFSGDHPDGGFFIVGAKTLLASCLLQHVGCLFLIMLYNEVLHLSNPPMTSRPECIGVDRCGFSQSSTAFRRYKISSCSILRRCRRALRLQRATEQLRWRTLLCRYCRQRGSGHVALLAVAIGLGAYASGCATELVPFRYLIETAAYENEVFFHATERQNY